MRNVLAALMIAIAALPAAAQIVINPNTTIIVPPKPMATIEFVQESGVERWEVKLTGQRSAIPQRTRRGRRSVRVLRGVGCVRRVGEIRMALQGTRIRVAA